MFSNFFKEKIIDESVEKQKEDLSRESPAFSSLAINGKDCDSLFNDKVEFGHSINNPIPVNGVSGEIKYINRLRCKCGVGLIYHRVRSVENDKIEGIVDIYETVCVEGKHWDILYLHLYHPRRSSWIPSGYFFSEFHPMLSSIAVGFGTNTFDENFPHGLGHIILSQLGEEWGLPLVKKLEEITKDRNKFIRPKKQTQNLQQINLHLSNPADHEMKLKSASVFFCIMSGSDVIVEELQKNVEELKDLAQEEIDRVYFIVSYVLLFYAQKNIWERGLVDNEKNASVFEQYLFKMFEKTTGKDPLPFIKDLVDYVRKDNNEHEQKLREIQYIGSKLCEEFKKTDAILMFKIVTVFSTLLPAFYESMKKGWDMPNNELEKILNIIEDGGNGKEENLSRKISEDELNKLVDKKMSEMGLDKNKDWQAYYKIKEEIESKFS